MFYCINVSARQKRWGTEIDILWATIWCQVANIFIQKQLTKNRIQLTRKESRNSSLVLFRLKTLLCIGNPPPRSFHSELWIWNIDCQCFINIQYIHVCIWNLCRVARICKHKTIAGHASWTVQTAQEKRLQTLVCMPNSYIHCPVLPF